MAVNASPDRLVGDIGGTNARFALADANATLYHERTLPGDDFDSLAAAARHYLDSIDATPVKRGAIAVATAVTGDRVSLTNRADWTFSIRELEAELGLERLTVINDFTAMALSLPYLAAADVRQVGTGRRESDKPRAVLGPGTGFGVSGLVPGPDRWIPLAGEGGHATFAPANAAEIEVVQRVARRYGHVSIERMLSGPGLVNLYRALAEIDAVEAPDLSPSAITEQALAGDNERARAALETFCAMLGTVSGNLALTLGARGGVYIAGGIVPQLGAFFHQSAFRERFTARGRLSEYLAAIPTFVVCADAPALHGAAAALDNI